MAFSDPASGFFSPTMPSAGPVDSGNVRQPSIPELQNIGSPRSQPFELVRPVNYQPDETGGTIAKGIGQLAQTASTAFDTAIKYNIKEDVRAGVDELLSKQVQAGLDQRQQLLEEKSDSNSLRNAPTGFMQGMSKLDTLDKAARSGALSNSAFFAQASDVVAALKQKYPAYGSVVDERMEAVLGVNPVKALRTSIQQDIDAIRKAQTDRLDAIDKHLLQNKGSLPDDWMQRDRMEMLQFLQKKEKFRQDASDDELRRKMMTNAGQDDYLEASKSFMWQFGQKQAELWQSFQKQVETASGKTFNQILDNGTPQDREALLGVLRQMQPELYRTGQMLLQATNTPGSDPSNSMLYSFARAGKLEEPEKIMKQLDRFQRIIDAVAGGDWTAVKSEARMLTAITSKAEADMWTRNKEFMEATEILKRVGPNVSNLMMDDKRVRGIMQNYTTEAFKLLNAKGGTQLSDFAKRYNQDHTDRYGTPPQDFSQKFQEKVSMLVSTDGDKDNQLQHWKDVYLDKDNTYITNSVMSGKGGVNAASDTFNMLTAPDITKKAQSMPDDIKQGYQKWAKDNFARVSTRLGDSIMNDATNNAYYDIKYDPVDNKLKTIPTELGKKNPAFYEASVQNYVQLDKLNQGLASMKPIVEMGGGDMNAYVSTILPKLQLGTDQLTKNSASISQELERRKAGSPIISNNPFIQNTNEQFKGTRPLMDLIIKGEASGNYDAMFGVKDAKITSMTLDEVLNKQLAQKQAGAESTAAGGPQFIRKTLEGLKKDMGLTGNELMTRELQDQLMNKLLERRGLNDYKSGKITKSKFIDNLAQEWASLPNTSGKGHYDGVGSNKANIKLSDLIDTLDSIR